MKRDLQFQQPYQIEESEKIWNFFVAGVRHGNSFAVRRVLPGRRIVVLFWTLNTISRQIKPGILKLTIIIGQSNLSIVFIFVSCQGTGYYNVLLVGQLSFDCRSYCMCSCHTQGAEKGALVYLDVIVIVIYSTVNS